MNKNILKVKINELFFSLFVFLISFVATVFVLMDSESPSEYRLLFLLPLTFGVLSVLFCRVYSFRFNYGIVTILFLEFFRFVIIPISLVLGDYSTAMEYTRTGHVESSILLMIYELIVVFIVLYLASKNNNFKRSNNNPKVKTNYIKYIILAMLLYLIIVAILFPGSVTSFKTIFDITNDDFTTWTGLQAYDRYDLNTMGRALGTLFTMVFSWIRYLFPIGIMVWCKKHIDNTSLAVSICLLPIVIQMLFLTNTIMDGILCALVLVLVLVKLFPIKRSFLISVVFLSFFGIIGYYFYARFITRLGPGGNIWSFISENATAYVSGVDNVAAMMNVSDDKKWSSFFYNIYGSIPFNSSLFGLKGEKLSYYFNLANGRHDGQIPPTIGVGWYFYTSFFAPLESALFTYFAVKFGGKAAKETNIWKYASFTLIAIMMAMGFTTYNAAIVLNYATTLLIPLLILCKYTNDLDFEVFEE